MGALPGFGEREACRPPGARPGPLPTDAPAWTVRTVHSRRKPSATDAASPSMQLPYRFASGSRGTRPALPRGGWSADALAASGFSGRAHPQGGGRRNPHLSGGWRDAGGLHPPFGQQPLRPLHLIRGERRAGAGRRRYERIGRLAYRDGTATGTDCPDIAPALPRKELIRHANPHGTIFALRCSWAAGGHRRRDGKGRARWRCLVPIRDRQPVAIARNAIPQLIAIRKRDGEPCR